MHFVEQELISGTGKDQTPDLKGAKAGALPSGQPPILTRFTTIWELTTKYFKRRLEYKTKTWLQCRVLLFPLTSYKYTTITAIVHITISADSG